MFQTDSTRRGGGTTWHHLAPGHFLALQVHRLPLREAKWWVMPSEPHLLRSLASSDFTVCYWKWPIYSWFTYETWGILQFAMLVYQRVILVRWYHPQLWAPHFFLANPCRPVTSLSLTTPRNLPLPQKAKEPASSRKVLGVEVYKTCQVWLKMGTPTLW